MPSSPHKIRIRVDRRSSVPAYRQIAEDLRYRIATGSISIGEKLPTLAEGAKLWAVNLHTVRRAYGELAAAGLTELSRGRGSIVTAKDPTSIAGARDDLSSFVDWVGAHAKARFGLEPDDLAALLTIPKRGGGAAHVLPVLECSEEQAAHHADEIAAAWDVETRGQSLERSSEPPPGPFVVTYFHYNDIRLRWPHRMRDAVFLSIVPSHSLKQRMQRQRRSAGTSEAVLYERADTMASSIAADISAMLGKSSIRLETKTIQTMPSRLSLAGDRMHLFPPRLWAQLTDAQRKDGNVFQVEYEITPADLAGLGLRFGWAPQPSQ